MALAARFVPHVRHSGRGISISYRRLFLPCSNSGSHRRLGHESGKETCADGLDPPHAGDRAGLCTRFIGRVYITSCKRKKNDPKQRKQLLAVRTQIRNNTGLICTKGPQTAPRVVLSAVFECQTKSFSSLSPRLRSSLSFTGGRGSCARDALALTDGVDRVGHHVVRLSSRNNDILKNNNGILQLGRREARHAGSRAKPRPRLVRRKLV